jgi:hypothetical protein
MPWTGLRGIKDKNNGFGIMTMHQVSRRNIFD